MNVFAWEGEIIHDIKAWARNRHEQMVQYRHTIETPTLRGVMDKRVEEGEMPESLYDTLLIASPPGIVEYYEELGRYDP